MGFRFCFFVGAKGSCRITFAKKSMSMYYNLTTEQMDRIREESFRFNEAWMPEEKRVVCELFRDGKRVEEIATMQGRTINAIRIKLIQAGEIASHLSRRDQPWTEQEADRLGRFYSQGYSLAECAKLLGRLCREVVDKLIEIGLLDASARAVYGQKTDYPNSHEPWSDEERQRLRDELSGYRPALAALASVAAAHGRSLASIVARAAHDGLCLAEERA